MSGTFFINSEQRWRINSSRFGGIAERIREGYARKLIVPPEDVFPALDSGLDFVVLDGLNADQYREFIVIGQDELDALMSNESFSPSGREALGKDWAELLELLRRDERFRGVHDST